MTSQSTPPFPADPEVKRNIEVLAAFVVRAGAQFEQLARTNTAGDPKFAFLLTDSPPGSEVARCHAFYEWKKKRLEQRVFANDGSDDLQLKICAMVDEARTPSKSHSAGIRASEKLNAQAGTDMKPSETSTLRIGTKPLKSGSSAINLDIPVDGGKGEMKLAASPVSSKRKAESSTCNILKKGMPQDKRVSIPEIRNDFISAASKEQNKHASKPIQVFRDGAKNAQEEETVKAARAGGNVGADQPLSQTAEKQVEKHSKESHGLKLLKTAVADYVKDILNPCWKEGNISKEAFKSLVKKIVDKVVGSLQAHQIPKSQENVDQYMAQSHAKISKLVQGYLDRMKKN
ncbi:hypothetical protein KP509_08G010400 [Ceratopteris richardii]|uniref:SURP motif domain-containing protein n=1 Tax=Ceratopteris richardii TaxID=49495 RepID=A0A8T2U9X3_CERRI|nr:hypothetical protein KP509_08G010400 [Ceratopteris richardii]